MSYGIYGYTTQTQRLANIDILERVVHIYVPTARILYVSRSVVYF